MQMVQQRNSLTCTMVPTETYQWLSGESGRRRNGKERYSELSTMKWTSSGEIQDDVTLCFSTCKCLDSLSLSLSHTHTLSQLQCPCLVQFMGACVDIESRECVIISELMSRGSLDSVLHVDKIPLDWNTRLGIVSSFNLS